MNHSTTTAPISSSHAAASGAAQESTQNVGAAAAYVPKGCTGAGGSTSAQAAMSGITHNAVILKKMTIQASMNMVLSVSAGSALMAAVAVPGVGVTLAVQAVVICSVGSTVDAGW
jgi:hypothetical protein